MSVLAERWVAMGARWDGLCGWWEWSGPNPSGLGGYVCETPLRAWIVSVHGTVDPVSEGVLALDLPSELAACDFVRDLQLLAAHKAQKEDG